MTFAGGSVSATWPQILPRLAPTLQKAGRHRNHAGTFPEPYHLPNTIVLHHLVLNERTPVMMVVGFAK